MFMDCSLSREKLPIRFGYTSTVVPQLWQRDSCLGNFEAHFETFFFFSAFLVCSWRTLAKPLIGMSGLGARAAVQQVQRETYRTRSHCDRP